MTTVPEPPSGEGARSTPSQSRVATWLVWGILLVGAALRIRQYAADRSLWLDEILLAANILDRPLRSLLTTPLDYGQGAPLGFLTLERVAVNVAGGSELVLRLVPFLAGLLALPLFLRVARSLLSPRAVVVAVTLFAFSPSLIFYTAEVKQYGVDVAVVLALFCLVGAIAPMGNGRWVALAVCGSVAVWISHPAVFALAAIGVAVFPGKRETGPMRIGVGWWIALVSVWLLSFGLNHAIHLRHLTASPELLDHWHRGFPPGRLPTPDVFFWLLRSVNAFFRFPAGSFLPPAGEETVPGMFDLSGVLVLAFVVGALALRRSPRRAALLLLPIAFVLMAAWLRSFPFQGRVVLFLAPMAFLAIGGGVSMVWAANRSLGIVLTTLVLLHPILFAAHGLRSPQLVEETRPVLEYVRDHHRPGDRVYLYYGAIPAHRFYSPRLEMEGIAAIEGVESRTDWRGYAEDLERLRGGGRTWVVFAHVCNWLGVDEERLFHQYLDRMGPMVETRRTHGASVSLHDFPAVPERPPPR